jgi:acyl dehydratase
MERLDLCKTEEERRIFEDLKSRIGKKFVPNSIHETLDRGDPSRCDVIYFFRWGEEADWSAIKKFAIAVEDFNALWFDEEYAKQSRWGGLIAPPLYLITAHDGLEAGFELFVWCYENLDKIPNFVETFEAETEWEFFEPVRPGDRIESDHCLADVYWKQGKTYRLLFLHGKTVLRNQKGQVVAHNRSGVFHAFK